MEALLLILAIPAMGGAVVGILITLHCVIAGCVQTGRKFGATD
jgi:hypothetical protein